MLGQLPHPIFLPLLHPLRIHLPRVVTPKTFPSGAGSGPSSSSKPLEPTQKSSPHPEGVHVHADATARNSANASAISAVLVTYLDIFCTLSALFSASSPLRTGSPLRTSIVMEPPSPPLALSPLMLVNTCFGDPCLGHAPTSGTINTFAAHATPSTTAQTHLSSAHRHPTFNVITQHIRFHNRINGNHPVSLTPRTITPIPGTSTRSYRPSFQPKGAYRPRTDEFAEARKSKRSAGPSSSRCD